MKVPHSPASCWPLGHPHPPHTAFPFLPSFYITEGPGEGTQQPWLGTGLCLHPFFLPTYSHTRPPLYNMPRSFQHSAFVSAVPST